MGTRVRYRHTSSSDTSKVFVLFTMAALFGLGGYLCQTVTNPATSVVVTLYIIGGVFTLAGVGALLPFRGNKRSTN